MLTTAGRLRTSLFAFLIAAASPLKGVETHVWDQSDFNDFTRGTFKNLSLRSDGHVTLGTSFQELDSTSVPYLWALTQDDAGTIYYAGGAPTGATAKVFRLVKGGKPSVAAEIPGLEIHALAVDKKGHVYAAVLPDAKIYRLDGNGKAALFFDAKCKYIWSMAFDAAGNLFVATGDTGLIYKVSPDGRDSKFFDSKETHVRSMMMDSGGNLIVGTEPSGLVMRISPAGESFVLYQTGKREVTAVAEHDGRLYAASVGTKTAAATVTGPSPVLPSNPAAATGSGITRTGTPAPSLAPAVGSLTASVSGGSDVYRIGKDGFAERVWQSATELVYAIGFDKAGRPLVGTGNKGIIYRLDSDQLWTEVLAVPPTQITAFLTGKDGTMFAATGNVGNVYAMTGSVAKAGTLTSEVLDAHEFTYWGKAHITAEMRGGAVELETRSGNLNNPENNWSAWKPVKIAPAGGQVESPAARFLQYRLTLKAGGEGSPEISAVDIAYLAKNIAPHVRAVEVAPLNYRQPGGGNLLERSVNAAGSPTSLTLPAVGQKRGNTGSGTADGAGSATLQYSKGFITVRWSASDENDDPLQFKLELRAKNSNIWHLLTDKLSDHFYAFDATAFADGEYIVRVTASDTGGNVPAEALTGSLESDSFHIDNTAPEITDIKMGVVNDGVKLTWTAKDATSWIGKAEFSLNGSNWTLVNPVNKVTDSQILAYELIVSSGESVAIRVFDENDNVQVKQFVAHN